MSPAKQLVPLHPRRILVPLDFSGQSRQAFRCALPLAEKFGAALLLLHVIPPPVYAAAEIPLVPPSPREQHFAARKRLAATAAACIPTGIRFRSLVRDGYPPREILSVARRNRTDMIVMSTKGRTGLQRLLLGSTAEYVVRHATCAVLAVPRHR